MRPFPIKPDPVSSDDGRDARARVASGACVLPPLPRRLPVTSPPRRVLMIAYHFPPFAGSSGVQRTLRFVQQLPRFGWEPLVLTAHPRAYEKTSQDLLRDIPEGTVVKRAWALDASRHLSIDGRYPGALARPDRWISWWLGAVPAALGMIRRHRPALMWSTYPIASAHRIAGTVQRLSGLPWIADFRDPMAQDGYPEDPLTWQSFDRIERATFAQASRAVFTTRGAAAMYRERYPDRADRIAVIENGFDEESFNGVAANGEPLIPGKVTLLHSGVIYPVERDPTQFFESLAALRQAGRIDPAKLRVRFRAPTHDALIQDLARRLQVDDFVECMPTIPYRDALAEMMRADGLLVMQAANCNEQIPAKVYEYLRAGRPLVGLTDPAGDTADLLHRVGATHIAPLDDAPAIARMLEGFLDDLKAGQVVGPAAERVRDHSRLARTEALAALLDAAVAAR